MLSNSDRKCKVAHIITRMIIGGAQENTYYSVKDLDSHPDYISYLLTGPETGPEGQLDISDLENVVTFQQLKRNISPLNDILALIKLTSYLRKNRFDVVHTHSSKAGIIGRLAAFISRTPLIIHTIHGLPFHNYQSEFLNRIYIFLEKIAALITDRIITVAPEMKRKVVEKKIVRSEKVVSIFSGMELNKFRQAKSFRKEMRASLKISDEKVVIGTIARLFPLKGHEYILKCAKDVIKADKNVLFLWIGGGILKKSLLQDIAEQNLSDHFLLTDLIKPENIPPYLSIVDIMVHPSLREGLARVIPQCFAAKIPVISFKIDGAVDIIQDKVNGFLVEPENHEQLGKALIELVQNKNLRNDFIEESQRKIDPFFDHHYMAEEIRKLYEELNCF